jgi:hypothetical protein
MCMKKMSLAQTVVQRQTWERAPEPTPVLSPWAPQLFSGGLGGRNSALHRCGSGGSQQPTHRGRRWKSRVGGATKLKDVKNEGTSGDVHENKCPWTICRHKKRRFCPMGTPFYAETHILQKPPAFFLLFERCGIKSSLSTIKIQDCRPLARHISGRKPDATPEMSKARGRIPFAARRGVLVESAPSWRRAFAAEVTSDTCLPVWPPGVVLHLCRLTWP